MSLHSIAHNTAHSTHIAAEGGPELCLPRKLAPPYPRSLHPKTVRRYIKQGKLHWTTVQGKYGREYRISRQSVEQLSTPVLSPPLSNLDSVVYKANTEAIERLIQVMEGLGQKLLPAAQGEQERIKALEEKVRVLEQELANRQEKPTLWQRLFKGVTNAKAGT